MKHLRLYSLVLLAGTLFPAVCLAQDTPELNGANTAWILVSTALVLFMTLPGLALFYSGLVRSKNVLSVLMQCFSIACLMSILWLVAGYGLAFGDGGGLNQFIGMGKFFLAGVGWDSLSGDIPETVFFMFQMTFAIITPALIVGGFAERMKFSAVLWFSALWLALVYAPICHWVWGGGWLGDLGLMDFAGGTVVHINAGVAAIVAAIVLGNRKGFPGTPMPPHNMTLTVAGASMLWVGWFGFNAGSALAADGKCRHGHAGHAYLRRGGIPGLGRVRMDQARQAQRAGHRHRHGGGPGHHNPGVGLRRPPGRPADRNRRRCRLLFRHPVHQARTQDRRFPGRVPGARSRRRARHPAHRRLFSRAAWAVPRRPATPWVRSS